MAQAGKRLAAGAGAAVVLALIAVLGIGAQSASAYTLGGGIIASYGGTWTVHYTAYTGYQEEITLTWGEIYPVSGEGGEPDWELTSAAGHVSVSSSPEPKEDCSATLSVNPAGNITPAGNGSWGAGILPENFADPAYSYSNGYWTVWDLQPPVTFGYPNDGLLSSEPYKELEYKVCANEQYYSQLGEGHYDTELAGTECHFDTNPEVRYDWISFPIGSNETANDNCEATGTDVSGNTWTAVLKSKISFYSPGGPSPSSFGTGASPPPPPPLPKNTDPSKHDAALDIPDAIKAAEVPCAAAGLGSLAAASKGGLLAGMLGGAGASQQVGDAGQAVLSGWAPLCEAARKRIEQDYKSAADPPAGEWHALAQPAKVKVKAGRSCKAANGKKKLLCELADSQRAVVLAAQRVASVDEAIELTISRQTAALDASEQSAANEQEAHAATLQGDLDKDLGAETRAEATRTKDLRGLGVRIRLTKKLKIKALHLILSNLATAGISEADLNTYAGGTLTKGS